MAKIRVAQIKDLSLENGVITIGTGNSITPLAQVNVAETTNSVITALAQSGNNLTATTKTFADIVSGGLVLTPAVAGTGVITSLTKSGNTLTAVYTDNSSDLPATSLAVMSGYTQDANGKITGTTKSFDATQFAENGNVISLHQNVLNASTYLGKDAIAITTIAEGADAGKKQVALTIDAADQVLTQSATGLKANLGLVYDSANKQIKLTGKTGEGATAEVIATIPATDFIKDGMLADATIVSGTWANGSFTESETGAEKAIKFVWKTYQQGQTGQEEVLKTEYLNVESLIDAYTAGNDWIEIDDATNKISHKTVENLDSTNTHGIVESVSVTDTTTKTFNVPSLKVDAAGHVTSVDEKTVTITLPASINTAIQEIEIDGGDYITATTTKSGTTETIELEAKIGTFSNEVNEEGEEVSLVDGLATTTAVEAYVEDYVANNAATQMKREVIAVSGNTAELSFIPEGDVAITQNGIDLNPVEYTVTGKDVTFTIDPDVAIDADDVFVAYYMYNPNTQLQA